MDLALDKLEEELEELPVRASEIDYLKKAKKEFDIDVKQASILAVGIGGAGGNTVTTLQQMGIEGGKTLAVNTDAKDLSAVQADRKILIGRELTKGLGSGGEVAIGRKAALESKRELRSAVEKADLVFVICGLGGGTGTGGAPIIAELAKSAGAIVIGSVTMPFEMEGTRIQKAEEGLKELRQKTDTVVVIENEKLLDYAGEMPLRKAFACADKLIATMIKGITETITQPSLVNLDYADVKTIMKSGGVAAIGVGEDDSSNRAREAIQKALSNPLLEMSYEGASGAIVHVTGGKDLKLDEINEVGKTVAQKLDPASQVIWGARISPERKKEIQVITIIAGVKSPYILGPLEQEEKQSSLGIPVIKEG